MHRGLWSPAAATVLTLAACSTGAQPPASGAPADTGALAEFARKLEGVRTELGIPGMSAAIGRNGQVVWRRSFGFADLENRAAVADTTTFHLASLTKAFAAVVLLRLVDSGLVALDDPVSKYGVSLPGGDAIKVRHLFSMTSGSTPPGEAFRYDGSRFVQLGAVIAKASGRSFAELARDWIFRPLGLTRTAPNIAHPAFRLSGLDSAAYLAALARPYAVTPENRVSPGAYPAGFSVSAGLISTAEDVVRFVEGLAAGKLLSPRMRELMFTPALTSSGTVLPYALGCFSQEYRGMRVIWSYGYWNAVSALMVYVPARGLSFAVLANADRLSSPFRLGDGRLLDSPPGRALLESFVFARGATP